MTTSAERTHGYVIRWRDDDGCFHYATHSHMVWDSLAKMSVPPLTLGEACIEFYRQRDAHGYAEIVRVRRVEGDSKFTCLSDSELDDLRVGYKEEKLLTWAQYTNCVVLFKRVPSEPRWEVVDDE